MITLNYPIFLQFYDGGNSASKMLGTFCSDTHSSTSVHSSSNQMYIKFRNSGFSKGRGFSLKYATGWYTLYIIIKQYCEIIL